jgi:hypothetical protein
VGIKKYDYLVAKIKRKGLKHRLFLFISVAIFKNESGHLVKYFWVWPFLSENLSGKKLNFGQISGHLATFCPLLKTKVATRNPCGTRL